MTEFKEGQKVRRIKGGEHVGMKVGDEGTVESVIGGRQLVIREYQRPGWSHAAGNFELVTETPQWSDVDFGDTVKVRYKKTGEEFTTVAHETFDHFNGPEVLGHDLNSRLTGDRFELLSIEKPKPQPPTTPGSHVTVPHPFWESGTNHLFLLDDGQWWSQTGVAFWEPESVADKDFTVIHDAGAKS